MVNVDKRKKQQEVREGDQTVKVKKVRTAPTNTSLLPPCKVCGEKAAGFHYGANTCEACKGFFRRTLVRGRGYICINGDEKCDIVQICKTDKKKMCPHCRHMKCLSVGMSVDAIKTGRYTHAKRTQDILEYRQVMGTTDVRKPLTPSKHQPSNTTTSTTTTPPPPLSSLPSSLPPSATTSMSVSATNMLASLASALGSSGSDTSAGLSPVSSPTSSNVLPSSDSELTRPLSSSNILSPLASDGSSPSGLMAGFSPVLTGEPVSPVPSSPAPLSSISVLSPSASSVKYSSTYIAPVTESTSFVGSGCEPVFDHSSDVNDVSRATMISSPSSCQGGPQYTTLTPVHLGVPKPYSSSPAVCRFIMPCPRNSSMPNTPPSSHSKVHDSSTASSGSTTPHSPLKDKDDYLSSSPQLPSPFSPSFISSLVDQSFVPVNQCEGESILKEFSAVSVTQTLDAVSPDQGSSLSARSILSPEDGVAASQGEMSSLEHGTSLSEHGNFSLENCNFSSGHRNFSLEHRNLSSEHMNFSSLEHRNLPSLGHKNFSAEHTNLSSNHKHFSTEQSLDHMHTSSEHRHWSSDCGVSSSECVVSSAGEGAGDCLSDEECRQLTDHLLMSHKVMTSTQIKLSPEELLDRQKMCHENCQARLEAFGPLGSVSEEEYQEVYQSTGIDIDGRQTFLNELSKMLDENIRQYIAFVKTIPGFSSLSIEDQIRIIKDNRCEAGLIFASDGYNQELKVITMPSGGVFCQHQMQKVCGQERMEVRTRCLGELKKLGLMYNEKVLFMCLIMFTVGHDDLDEPEKVSAIQWKVVQCLLWQLRENGRPNPNMFFSKIISSFCLIKALTKVFYDWVKSEPFSRYAQFTNNKLLAEWFSSS